MRRSLVALLSLALGSAAGMSAETTTILYRDEPVVLERTLPDPNDLWVKAEDLPSVNGFVLKPEGACLDELCVPVKQDRDSELFARRGDDRFLCVSKLADRLGQRYAVDHEKGVWSFGEIPATRRAFLEKGMAPDFTLPDLEGDSFQLADLRGKKVLLITWASW